MTTFEITITCIDQYHAVNTVKQNMERFENIMGVTDNEFAIVGNVSLRNFREIVRIISELKEKVGDIIEDVSVRVI